MPSNYALPQGMARARSCFVGVAAAHGGYWAALLCGFVFGTNHATQEDAAHAYDK